MQVDFQNSYVIAVIFFMVFIWFAKNFVELLGSICVLLEKCSLCFGRDCVGYEAHHLCGMITRQTLAIFCFFQPLILCLIEIVNRSRDGDFSSTVVLCSVKLNQTALVVKHNGIVNGTTELILDHGKSSCMEIDYLLLIMPFAAVVSITTLAWIKLSSKGELHQDTIWDEGIYTSSENDAVFYYDLTYCFEIWFMNFSFIMASASGQSFWTLFFVTQALSVGVFFFIVSARHQHETIIEHWVGTLFFLYIICVLLPFWNELLQKECVTSIVLASTHSFCLFLIVCGHYVAMGKTTAGYILSLRIIVTVIACVTNIITMLVGRNRFC
tara:strand:+ start:5455 stop:6432 length:978 start_codon:yes stop_codon:yes gene_type:complete